MNKGASCRLRHVTAGGQRRYDEAPSSDNYCSSGTPAISASRLTQYEACCVWLPTPTRHANSVDAIARNHLTAITRKIARLSALRREVTRMIAQCRRGRIAECRVIDALLSDRKAKSPQRPRGAGAKKRPDLSAR